MSTRKDYHAIDKEIRQIKRLMAKMTVKQLLNIITVAEALIRLEDYE